MTDVQMNTEPPTGSAIAPVLPFPVVGIVGSAGSRQPLEARFRHLPDDSGLAFVVVVRLAAKQQSQLRAALAARTNMNVVVAADGIALKADQVYLAPPALQLTMANGQLQLHIGPVGEPGFPAQDGEALFVAHADNALFGLAATGDIIETDLALAARMEEELVRTRERLQRIVEEYELSSQELKASNAELQSINEELKSTTKELETRKAELQAMNEELVTVNGELTHKIEELHRANSDLLNLVVSTDVGALFLDQQLRVKRFTPRAVDLFNLIDGDIGRPFAHLTHQLRHTGLLALAEHVQTAAVRMEETVQSTAGHWYILRLFPYQTVTGAIDGIVITFIDISDLKRAESEERQRRQQQSLAALSHQALAGDDLDQLLSAATQQVAAVLELELCKILALEPGGETLFLRAGVGWHEGVVGQTRVPTDGGAQAGYTLRTSAPVVVRDLETETRFCAPQLLLDHGVRSGISITIPGSAGYYGVIGVHSRTPHAFATYDVDYLQSVANTLGAAIARWQTEGALRASEERFRYLIEQASDAIFIADGEGVYTDINSSACRLLGYHREELIGQPLSQIVARADRPQWLAAYAQLRAGGETQTAEWTLLRKDGTSVAVEVSSKILPNGVWQAIGRDITERKDAAEEVKRLNRELNRRLSEMQTLLDAAPIGIAVAHDPHCQLITINPAGAAMLGTVDEENVSLSSSDAVLPFRVFQQGRAVPAAELPMQYAATHNVAIQRVEYDIVWANGQVRNLYEYASPLYDEGGAVRGCLGIFVDITERKLVEQALQASETQLRLVTDNISGLISYVDREERYRFVNAVYEAWFNQPCEQIIGHSVRETLGDAGYAIACPYVSQALNGERTTFENTITYPDGVTRTVLSTYVPDVDKKGQTLGFYALITDISERKQAEERLRFLAEASNTLAGSLDYKLTLQNVGQVAVPTIADWCAIDLVAADGSLQDVVIAHVDPAKVRWAKELREQYPIDPNSPAGAPLVIRTGQSEYYPLITDEMLAGAAKNEEELALLKSVGYRSIMIVPLQAQGRVLGTITFVAAESARSFTSQDLAMAEEVARRAAAAIGNAQLHEAVQTSAQQLRASEERLRLALEAGQMATWDWDVVSDQMVWSEQFEPLLGLESGAFGGTYNEFLTLIHPEDGPLVSAALQEALAGDADYHLEFRMLRTDGQPIWIEARGRVYRNAAGQPLRMAGMYLDIARRKLAEAELRRSEAQFRAVQQATPDGFMIFDSIRADDGEIVDFRWAYTNPAGETMLGRRHAELVGKQMLVEMPGNREEGLFDAYRQVVESGEVWQREFRYAHEGLDHWFQSTAAKAGDGFAVAFSNVTERKRAEEALRELTANLEQRVAERTAELERSNSELDQFAYVASHDLKAPLRAIINLANWLAEDAADRLLPTSLEHLNKLRSRAQRMERLLDDLLTYSRIGRRDGAVEQVKIETLLQDVVYLLSPPPGFALVIEGELPTLLTPRTPLELVLRNLIGNAIKHHHHPARGEVRIRAQEEGDYIRFGVADNGPGIEPQYFERIFGMFQVLKPRDEVEGSGMGLAIVKKTVEYRGGYIGVETNEGVGVTVYFTWPKAIT